MALATVAATWGSAPVPVGGQLVVAPDERFEGSVSGGCVEAAVIVEAANLLAEDRPRLLTFGVSDEMAWQAGLPCGGTIQILLESLRADRDAAYLDALISVQQTRKPLLVLTDLATGARRFGASLDLPAELAEIAARGQSRIVETPSGDAFLQTLPPPLRLVIIGATHIAQHLTAIATATGCQVIIVDPRQGFSNPDRFGETRLVAEWPEAALAPMKLGPRTAVIALSHVLEIDDEAICAALPSGCLYIGALGSKRTHAKRLERLKQKGFSDEALGRIHAPIGLPIGAVGPAEIAISILAEIIAVARSKDLKR